MDLAGIENIKQRISSAFSDFANGINGTVDEFSRFIEMMDPYVDYFFSGGKGENSFIGDVVLPSQKNLSDALGSAVKIMHSDTMVHDSVGSALERVLTLRGTIEEIIALLDSITTYSVNTIIISAKAGDEGKGLSAISEEMAQMSKNGSEISSNVTSKISNLLSFVDGFREKRSQIETLHETSLTRIHLSSKNIFKDLIEEFNRLSGEVLSEYAAVSTVSGTLRSVIEKFQHEDIVRQNFEKILFSTDEYLIGDFSEFDAVSHVKMDRDIFCRMAIVKSDEISADINTMNSQIGEALSGVLSVIDVFSSVLSIKDNETGKDAQILENLYGNLENLKKDFERYISQIIEKKDRMHEFLVLVRDEINGFEHFFDDMDEISGMFKTIILLTHIELSRYDSLNQLLGGALSDVKVIPDKIQKIISEGRAEFGKIKNEFESTLMLYNQTFSEQKDILSSSVRLVKDISVQVYESKKYHTDFINETCKKITGVRDMVDNVNEILSGFVFPSEQFIPEECRKLTTSRQEMHENYSELLKEIYRFYSSAEDGNYRKMMLASLASELISGHTDRSVVFF